MTQKHYNSKPLVSVIIPCYNYGRYLEEAVQSVARQSYKNIEIIIIDDGSTDSTSKIVQQLMKKHKSLKYIHQENSGIVKTRNKGLELAGGEFTLQLDADDYLDKNYVEDTVKVARDTDADIVYTNVIRFGEEDSISNFPAYSIEELKNHNFIHVSSLLRTSALKGVAFDENLSGMTHEDWDFFLNLCLHGRKAVLCISANLHYRIHNSGRNNRFSVDSDRRKYIDVYAYVIDKYRNEFPEQFGFLASRVFADWYAVLDDNRRRYVKQAKEALLQRDIALQQKYVTDQQLETITNSKRYRIASMAGGVAHPLRSAKKIARKIYRLPDQIRQTVLNLRDTTKARKQYELNDIKFRGVKRPTGTHLAVVLHLYYIDLWPEFVIALSRFADHKFDLFITIPLQHKSFEKDILKQIPNATVLVVPNRGRDVLPFVWIASHLRTLGYRYFLKLHSKKSKHRADGEEWFRSILQDLLPNNKKKMESLIQKLEKGEAAVIGPKSQYVSFGVNYEQNKACTIRVLRDLKVETEAVSIYRYGFFAGTMFWGRLDAIKDVIALNYSVADFQLERGQIDATLSHALERAFCVLPEIQKKNIYGLQEGSLQRIRYDSGVIPIWSDLYIDPRD